MIKSLVDDIKLALKTISNVRNQVDKQMTKSIARGANDQSFQFPCLISDSVGIDSATTLARMLDRMYAQFTQIYLSGCGVIDLNVVRNPRQFIAQYQSNFKLESADEDMDPMLESIMYDEATNLLEETVFSDSVIYMNSKGTAGLLVTEAEKPTKKICELNKKNSKGYLSEFNTSGLTMEDVPSKLDMINNYLDGKQEEKDINAAKLMVSQSEKRQAPSINNGDIKKVNDMQPFSLELKVFATKGDTALGQYITFNVGVKTFLHLIRSDEMSMNIAYVLKNNNKMFNFIRLTTGEISLFKDLIFHIDDMNFDMVNKTGGSKYFPMLKKLKQNKLKLSGTRGITNKAPFATLVISSVEYDEILNKYGYDLKNITIARKLMNELFLMTFIIVDEGTQTIDILFEHYNYGFQTYSLDSLEREVSMSSAKLGKELTKMLGSN